MTMTADMTISMAMTKEEFVRHIDHSLLKPQLTVTEIRQGCEFAKATNCATVCVNPTSILLAKEILDGSNTKINSVVAFPSGAHLSYIKAKEAAEAYKLGAREIDTVINIGALKSGQYSIVKQDIAEVVQATPAIVKVILETCYLTDEEKVIACKLVEEAGAHYVKTSTGFASGGATLADIRLMRQSVGPHMKVKAAGGIKTLKMSLELLEAGTDRLGLSSTKQILDEFMAK